METYIRQPDSRSVILKLAVENWSTYQPLWPLDQLTWGLDKNLSTPSGTCLNYFWLHVICLASQGDKVKAI